MKRSLLVLAAAAAVLLAGDQGVPPRARPTDYPARQTAGAVTLAAEQLSAAEAKKVFTADLDRAGYLVFEVAVYPADGTQIDVAADQFTLRVANDSAIVPTSSPEAIVEAMYKGKRSTPQLPEKVHVYNTATVGYDSGGPGRKGGVYAGGGTAVAVGDPPMGPPPGPTSNAPTVDRDSLLGELTVREFPNTKATAAVAGYLYFAKPAKPKNGTYQLTFNTSGLGGEQVVLQVPVRTGK